MHEAFANQRSRTEFLPPERRLGYPWPTCRLPLSARVETAARSATPEARESQRAGWLHLDPKARNPKHPGALRPRSPKPQSLETPKLPDAPKPQPNPQPGLPQAGSSGRRPPRGSATTSVGTAWARRWGRWGRGSRPDDRSSPACTCNTPARRRRAYVCEGSSTRCFHRTSQKMALLHSLPDGVHRPPPKVSHCITDFHHAPCITCRLHVVPQGKNDTVFEAHLSPGKESLGGVNLFPCDRVEDGEVDVMVSFPGRQCHHLKVLLASRCMRHALPCVINYHGPSFGPTATDRIDPLVEWLHDGCTPRLHDNNSNH